MSALVWEHILPRASTTSSFQHHLLPTYSSSSNQAQGLPYARPAAWQDPGASRGCGVRGGDWLWMPFLLYSPRSLAAEVFLLELLEIFLCATFFLVLGIGWSQALWPTQPPCFHTGHKLWVYSEVDLTFSLQELSKYQLRHLSLGWVPLFLGLGHILVHFTEPCWAWPCLVSTASAALCSSLYCCSKASTMAVLSSVHTPPNYYS